METFGTDRPFVGDLSAVNSFGASPSDKVFIIQGGIA
jgi:hypothetical protein